MIEDDHLTSTKEKTDAELKQLAMDMLDGKVFANWNIRKEDMHMLPTIFMPLIFLGEDGDIRKLFDNEETRPAIIYEYMSKAESRSCNGYPSFCSFSYLSEQEYKRLLVFYKEYEQMKDKFKKG